MARWAVCMSVTSRDCIVVHCFSLAFLVVFNLGGSFFLALPLAAYLVFTSPHNTPAAISCSETNILSLIFFSYILLSKLQFQSNPFLFLVHFFTLLTIFFKTHVKKCSLNLFLSMEKDLFVRMGLKRREGSPLSNLELGIGTSGGLRGVIKEEKDQLGFTAEQFQELQLQILIFRYLLSGLPLPIDLVLPLWKGVATSLASSKSGIYDQLTSLLGFSHRDFDYRSMMDPEPGRCRRTDGKKWRCYRDVVPNQKYCERHMHRGCQRSRKHVETSEVTTTHNTSATNSDILASSVISSNTATTDSRISASISTSLSLTVPSSNISKTVPGTFRAGFPPHIENGNLQSKGNTVVRVNNGKTTSSLVRAVADKNIAKCRSKYADGKGMKYTNISTKRIERGSQGNKSYYDASVVPGFGLSPKSVLECGTATGCSRLSFGYQTNVEMEPLRCRRTDGKKWRCSRDVVPDRKYCENHLHRGAKKAMVGSKLTIGAPAAPSLNVGTCGAIPKVEKLNTKLSISIAASPQKTSDADSSSFSYSDATTVTDENVTSSHILLLSP